MGRLNRRQALGRMLGLAGAFSLVSESEAQVRGYELNPPVIHTLEDPVLNFRPRSLQQRPEVCVDNVLIYGVGYGIDDARKAMQDCLKDPLGEEFDYVFSSNLWGVIPFNLIHSVEGRLGVSLLTPKQDGIKSFYSKKAWAYSQGCDTAVNWINGGKMSVDELHLIGPPIGPFYVDRLERLAERFEIEKIHLHLSYGKEKYKVKNVSKGRREDWKKVICNEYMTSGDESMDRGYLENGIWYNEFWGMPEKGHFLEVDHVPNIREAGRRLALINK